MGDLRSKLNRIVASSAAPLRPGPAGAGGLLERVHEGPVPEGLFGLNPKALRRMGFDRPLDVRNTAFLDTETTGLMTGAGTVAFLVGVGAVEDGRFVVRQLLMPSYADESALCERATALLAGRDALITFNGKSFDAPLMASRFAMCRMNNPLEALSHLDLIHPARRAWKLRLKTCELGRLEAEILGCPREDDLPGAEVPARYFEFLRTGDMGVLEDVLKHNLNDIRSLASLLVRLGRVYGAPAEQTEIMDLFSLGRALEKGGERDEAGRLYRMAARPQPATSIRSLRAAPVNAQANERLSKLLKRGGELDQAEAVWREMVVRGQMGASPHVELSKLMEHAHRDAARALEHAERALRLAESDRERDEIMRRIERLTRRLGAERNGG